jgi:uncharacterized protein YndB with AHSA1/START domain
VTDDLTLHLEREMVAPRDQVFRSHVDPEQLAQWWGPTGFTVPSVDLDVRLGGTYRIAMQPPDGERFVLTGEFLRVEPPTVLRYTFRWEPPDVDDRETIATLELVAMTGGTLVKLDQGPFLTEARRQVHLQGWTETLERLDAFLAVAS